jgi:parallel beta-helix repeat protein
VAADGAPFAGGVIGVQIEKGTTAARHLLVSTQTQNGIRVGPDAKLDGEKLEISGIGNPLEGAGILLLSNGSSVRSSSINGNPAAGIALGTAEARAVGNTIDGNVISGNGIGVLLSPDASRNVIMRNDIMWNRFGGVSVLPFETAPPRENRISANRFDENGLRPIILDPAAPEPNLLDPGADSCAPVPSLANLGLPAPRVTSVLISDEDGLRVRVRGTGCPGQIVEIYQSFVTSEVRERSAVTPQVRDRGVATETLTAERRMMVLPSIGEFNYLGATNTRPDGTFEATFPLPVVTSIDETDPVESDTDLWARQVMPAARQSDRAFSAIAIDPAGNTSEMSVRRRAD